MLCRSKTTLSLRPNKALLFSIHLAIITRTDTREQEMIATNEAMLMSREGLVSSLHRVGHLYWHRPDTADCLVEVTRMGASQHQSRSQYRSSASLPSFASSSRAASAAEGKHVRRPEERLCAAAVRRESAPTSMYASVEDARCRQRRCSLLNQAQTPLTRTFRLHQDFLTSQSDLFRELLTSQTPSRPLSPWCITKGFDRIELKPRTDEATARSVNSASSCQTPQALVPSSSIFTWAIPAS